MIGLNFIPDTLSESSDDDEVTQVHSKEPGEYWQYDHWKLVRSSGGWCLRECKCTLDPEDIVYYKTYR